MLELLAHILFGTLYLIGETIVEGIFETFGEILNGALEGMWNRINGRFW